MPRPLVHSPARRNSLGWVTATTVRDERLYVIAEWHSRTMRLSPQMQSYRVVDRCASAGLRHSLFRGAFVEARRTRLLMFEKLAGERVLAYQPLPIQVT